MAEITTGEYIHRSIDQLRSMNERGTLGAVIHDYKQFADLRNNIVTDYTIKNNINNNNTFTDNRNISASSNINNQSPSLDHKHHQHYRSSSTPPTPLSITDAQMNDAKVRSLAVKWLHPGKLSVCTSVEYFQLNNAETNLANFWLHQGEDLEDTETRTKWLKINIVSFSLRKENCFQGNGKRCNWTFLSKKTLAADILKSHSSFAPRQTRIFIVVF